MADRTPDDAKKTDDDLPLSSPYGPQYRGVDEAAGGADSSPYENAPTGERMEHPAAPPDQNRGQGATRNG